MKIYCCGCSKDVEARLTNGYEVYPHRADLALIPFWMCDTCGCYVGCHYKTDKPTRPLGVISTPEVKSARQHIHKLLDPIWKTGKVKRSKLYKMISERVGWKYHTAKIRSVEEGREVYRVILQIRKELNNSGLQQCGE